MSDLDLKFKQNVHSVVSKVTAETKKIIEESDLRVTARTATLCILFASAALLTYHNVKRRFPELCSDSIWKDIRDIILSALETYNAVSLTDS